MIQVKKEQLDFNEMKQGKARTFHYMTKEGTITLLRESRKINLEFFFFMMYD